jgi:hypothetical protein
MKKRGKPAVMRNRTQISIYIESALKRKIEKEAKANGTSAAAEIRERLNQSFKGK